MGGVCKKLCNIYPGRNVCLILSRVKTDIRCIMSTYELYDIVRFELRTKTYNLSERIIRLVLDFILEFYEMHQRHALQIFVQGHFLRCESIVRFDLSFCRHNMSCSLILLDNNHNHHWISWQKVRHLKSENREI